MFARLSGELARLGCAQLFAHFEPTKRNGLMHEVLTAIEHTERPERDESDPVHGGAAAVGPGEAAG